MSAVDPLERGGTAAEIPRPGEAELAAPGVELISMLLKSLGNTPDEVATTLLRDGARGDRNRPCRCPVYEWLTGAVLRHLPPDVQVIIDGVTSAIEIQVWQPGCSAAFAWVPIPAPVGRFIDAFDGGLYPDLERRYPDLEDEA